MIAAAALAGCGLGDLSQPNERDGSSQMQVGEADLTLVGAPTAGTTVTFEVTGADPSKRVRLFWVKEGTTGAAKCSLGVCLDLEGRANLAGSVLADSTGKASFSVTFPAGSLGTTRSYQAFAFWGGSQGTTDVVTVDITDGTNAEPPSAPTFSVAPDPARSDLQLSAVITNPGVDPDGDVVTNEVTWLLNGVTQHTGSTLDPSLTSRDDVWEVEVTATDGTFTSAPATATVTIANALPVASGVTITPSSPTAGTTLNCAYTFTDADGDANASTIEWLVDGSVVGTGSSHVWTGPGAATCTVTPFDGLEEGAPVSATTSGSTPPTGDPGNVLMILLDDVGADQIGLYGIGSEVAQTPTIDGLAAEGVLFQHAYAQPACSPTRAQILTGRRGYRTGVPWGVPWDSSFVLPTSEVLVPTMLDEGTGGLYDHSYIGKWHLNTLDAGYFDHPNQHGFAFYAGSLEGVGSYTYTSDGLTQTHFNWERVENGVPARSTQYTDSNHVDTALTRMDSMEEPWFVMVGLVNAHDPYVQPPSHLYSGPAVGGSVTDHNYHWMIEAADTEIGRMLDSMDPTVLSRTTVIVMADNGTPSDVIAPEFNPNRAKLSLYEGGTHVPLIVSGPLVVDGGREVSHLVEATDLFTTFADIADAELDPTIEIDGVSLVPYLVDPAAPAQRDHVYAERTNAPGFGPYTRHDKMVRDDRYKLIRYSNRDELYDMLNRDVEGTNLLANGVSATEQAIIDELEAKLPL